MSRRIPIYGLMLVCGVLLYGGGCGDDGPTGGGDAPDFSDTLAFEIQIEKTYTSIQGRHKIIEVSLSKAPYQLSGFDFKIVFDTFGLQFQKAIPSDPHGDNGWEDFAYESSVREGPTMGMVRLTATADAQSEWPPLADTIIGPVPLFGLDFLVSEDRTLERAYIPIRFYWEDCDDNVLIFRTTGASSGEVTTVTKRIFDFDLIGDISADSIGFPTFQGYQRECYVNTQGEGTPPPRMLDLLNGGVDIMGCDSITELGDVNLNASSFEISDLVLFTRYFSEGLDVLENNDCAVGATNANRDWYPLTSSDWVYFIRKVVGGALPLDSLIADSAICTHNDGMVSVDQPVQAAQFIIVGEAQWGVRQYGLEALSHFDGFDTRVLVYKPSVWDADSANWATFSGSFFWTNGEIRKIDMSTVDGARVDVRIVRE